MLQSCANVKSAAARLGERNYTRKDRGCPNNILIFNILRREMSLLFRQARWNPQANLNEEVTVSTTFSTADEASNAGGMGPVRGAASG